MTIEVAPAIASDLTYIDSLQRKNAEQLAFIQSKFLSVKSITTEYYWHG